jgi:diguanylate cyclase (GGDEF)-like protein
MIKTGWKGANTAILLVSTSKTALKTRAQPGSSQTLASRITKLTKIPFGTNEPLLQRALQAGGVGLWEYLPSTNLIDFYHNVLAFQRLGPGRYYGPVSDFADYVIADDKPRVQHFLSECERSADHVYLEYRVRTSTGKIVWLACKGERTTLDDGRTRYVGTITDITESSERELRLLAYHESLYSLARNPLVVDRGDFDAASAQIVRESAMALKVTRSSLWQFETGNEQQPAGLYCRFLHDARPTHSQETAEGVALESAKYPVYLAAIAQRRTLAVEDALNDAVLAEFRDEYLPAVGVRALLDVPLFSRGKLWGVICYEDCVGERNWDADAQSFASSAADLVAIALESSQRAMTERELTSERERHRAFIQAAVDAIWCVDINPPIDIGLPPNEQLQLIRERGQITDANPTFARDYGRSLVSVRGQRVAELMPELFKGASLIDWIDRGYRLVDRELTQRGRGDTASWLSMTLLGVVEDGELVRFWGARRNITDRKRYQNLLEHLAFRDPLTGLLNRQRLVAEVTDVLNERLGTESPAPCALLLIDLNQFKDINDTLGHSAGDEVLRQMRQRLDTAIADTDATAARLGGDEFGIFARQVATAEQAMKLGEAVTASMLPPFDIAGSKFHMSASIGSAIFPIHGKSFSELSRSADEAMYAAKQTGGGARLFSRNTVVFEHRKLGLLARLPSAIEAGELLLEFQPIINCATRKTARMEALVRWNHPEYGRLEAKDFVHKAEMSDSIRMLTRWVIDRALDCARQWQSYAPGVGVSVNISPRLLGDTGVVDHLRKSAEKHGVAPRLVDLEITETSLFHNQERAAQLLADCRALGFSIVIDDYGVGFCSLSYLRRLPLRGLKVDSSFVTRMTTSAEDAIIVQSTVALAHNLGLTVVAEGVEDAATLAQLQAYGCDFAQGYGISYPLGMSDAATWLRTGRTDPPGERLRAVK